MNDLNLLVRDQNLVGIFHHLLSNHDRAFDHKLFMGLENREGGNFITILGGKFCQRVPSGTEGSVERTNKLGKIVSEKFYDSFTAKLVGIRTQDGAYGKSWLFDFQDGAEIYHLQLSYSNSFATAFLKMLPNVDLSQEIKVSPSVKMEGDKQKSSLFINQNGVPIKHAYTKDAPNGMPDMEQVTIKGQLVWDDTKRLVFLQNMVDTLIIPKLPKQTAAPSTHTSTSALDVFDDPKTDDDEGF